MNGKRWLFVVSDIHGHYTQMKRALDEAGFDKDDPRHLLVCCGDLFDRGRENREVYDYIRRLPNKVLVCGNHDERLAESLKQRRITPTDLSNGIETTLQSFFKTDIIGAYGELQLPKHGKMAGNLRRFVAGMRNYFETERYVFVHGWLPLGMEDGMYVVRDDWRTADAAAWRKARFLQWTHLYDSHAKLDGKTIVCGHRHARLAATIDPTREADDSSIYYGDGFVAIDAGTVRSGRVNVLVLEETLLTGETV